MPVSETRGAWWATLVLFLALGLAVSTWISRIPAVQSALHLSNFALGLALAGSAVGALCAIPLTGMLVGKFGSRRVAVAAGCLCSSTLLLPALAVNALTLAGALFIFGASSAAMDVSMNAQAVEVEHAMKTPTMSRFHALFSVGAMAGAAIGGAVAARGIGVVPHFAISGALNAAAVLSVHRLLLNTPTAPNEETRRVPLRKMPRLLLALCAIGFCSLLSEGAMADWIAIYLRQTLQAGLGTAAAGYSIFSGAMAGSRFVGDFATARLGPHRAVRSGALLAALGLTWALFARSPLWAMPGFGLAGCGLSIVVPLVLGSAGRVKGVSLGTAVATISGVAYLAFLAGPPTIGFLSQFLTLRGALFVVVGCCLVAAFLAGEMEPSTAEKASATAMASGEIP